MGYEIIYHYKESLGGGEYSEEVKEKTVKVGNANDDIPLEAAAAKVMAQLARRNILITDVEIYEFTKKKLSYKETDDGIVIKNKKFRFDDGPVCVGTSDEESELAELLENPDMKSRLLSLLQQSNGIASAPTHTSTAIARPQNPAQALALSGRRPKRMEIFDPDPRNHAIAQSRGLRFTVGKAYPVLEERQKGVPPVTTTDYVTIDDRGRETTVAAEYFVVKTAGLRYDGLVDDGRAPSGDIDLWGNTNVVGNLDDMPDLRR